MIKTALHGFQGTQSVLIRAQHLQVHQASRCAVYIGLAFQQNKDLIPRPGLNGGVQRISLSHHVSTKLALHANTVSMQPGTMCRGVTYALFVLNSQVGVGLKQFEHNITLLPHNGQVQWRVLGHNDLANASKVCMYVLEFQCVTYEMLIL